MTTFLALGALSLPFVYLFAPPLAANAGGFVFWVLYLLLLVSQALALLRVIPFVFESRPSWLRFIIRLMTGLGILSLAAFGHYVMAGLQLLVFALGALLRARHESIVAKQANH